MESDEDVLGDELNSNPTSADDRCCYMCGQTPCEWLTIGMLALPIIVEEFDVCTAVDNGYVKKKSTGEKVPNNIIRFAFYKLVVAEKYGHLGRGNRIRCKPCIDKKVREFFPDSDGNYTGFNSGDD
jgi:hypothetical protein